MLTQERLKELLDYDPETGLFTRRVTRGGGAAKGCVAGTVDKNGYRAIMVDRQFYKAHRLAFLYMEGSFPRSDVDHINREPSDNRWANLRRATRSENNRNTRLYRNNTSGMRGVSWDKSKQKWVANGRLHGVLKKLGSFTDKEEAGRVAAAWRAEHHGDFAVA